ncbi:MAG: zinc ribbon domain-containing protein [Anaerolineaceae bacterium]
MNAKSFSSKTVTHKKASNLQRGVFLIGIIFTLLFMVAPRVQGRAEDIVIEHLQVDIWPEYDRPSVLVICNITLTEDTVLPAKLSLKIPAEVISPSRLAMVNQDGIYTNVDYTTQEQKDWIIIDFETNSTKIQLEYYDQRLTFSGYTRTYRYDWQNPYPVKMLSVRVQEPVNTKKMSINPDMGIGQVGDDGLVYYASLSGEIPANKTYTVVLKYEKSDYTLSSGLLPVSPVEPITIRTEGRTTITRVIPWAMALLGILMIISGGFWYWYVGRKEPAQELVTPPIEPTLHSLRQAEQLINQTFLYCAYCGKSIQKGDKFCRECGKLIQKEK